MFGRQSKSEEGEARGGFFKRLRARLNRGNSWLTYDLGNLFRGRKIDAEILEELETRLLTADWVWKRPSTSCPVFTSVWSARSSRTSTRSSQHCARL